MNEIPEGLYEPKEPIWYKSSKSYSDGHCVEVAWTGQRLLIRDSQDATGPKLEFNTKSWASFVKDVKVN